MIKVVGTLKFWWKCKDAHRELEEIFNNGSTNDKKKQSMPFDLIAS